MSSDLNASVRRILIVARYAMMRRLLLHTPVLPRLAELPHLEVHLATPSPEDAGQVAQWSHVHWHPIDQPSPILESRLSWGRRSTQALHRALRAALAGKMDYPNLAFRFNYLSGFESHKIKLRLPPERRQIETQAGNYADPTLGQPFPHSWTVFRALYGLHYAPWQYNDEYIEAFFEQCPPDLVVLIHVQNREYKPYAIAARRRHIPILGVVGSWDQPTTKGCILPGIGHFAVHNQQMADDLERYHSIPSRYITVTGWQQMDAYRAVVLESGEQFRARLGLPPQQKLLVFGGNRDRLGQHEPQLIQQLGQDIRDGLYGENVSLIVRSHPIDSVWQTRFRAAHHPPQVLVQPPTMDDLSYLANLLHHASAVMATAGSILLDAVAQDTAAIGVAFANEAIGADNPIADYYRMDHNAGAVKSGGIELVYNMAELRQLLQQLIAHPEHQQVGRARLRASHLEPLDGKASERLVALIERAVGNKIPFSPHDTHYPWRKP